MGGPTRVTPWMMILFAITVLHASGCTVIGYATGYSLDRNSRTEVVPIECDDPALQEGRRIRLTLKDGRKLSGHLVERCCSEESVLLVEVQRRNREDATETIRTDAIEIVEVQTRETTETLTAVGFLADLTVALLILEVYSGTSGLR